MPSRSAPYQNGPQQKVALSGLILAQRQNLDDARNSMARLPQIRRQLIKSLPSDREMPSGSAFSRKKPAGFVSMDNDADRSLAWQNGPLASGIAPKLLARLFALRLSIQRYLFFETLALGEPFSQSLDKPLVAFSAFGLRSGERGVRHR